MTDPVNAEDDLVKRLWLATKHGDADHQTWLRDAYEAFFSGEPVPAVRGKGNKERRIAALEAVRSTRDGEIERYREALADIASTDEAFVHTHGEAGAVARIVDRASQALNQGTDNVG